MNMPSKKQGVKKVVPFVSGLMAVVGAIFAFKPETFWVESYPFAQYLMSVLAIPIMVLGIFVLMVLLLLKFAPGASASFEICKTWLNAPTSQKMASIKTANIPVVVLLVVSIGFAGFEVYKASKSAFIFTRDRIYPRYKDELIARANIDLSLGNLYVAKREFSDFSDRFKDSPAASGAEASAKMIERMLLVKNGLLQRAHDREKIFGANKTSTQQKTEAYAINPWDFSLRAEIESDIKRIYKDYLPGLMSDARKCKEIPASSENIQVGRHLAILGYERAINANIHSDSPSERMERFCDLVGGTSSDQVTSLIDSIWQREMIEQLLQKYSPEVLAEKRRKILSDRIYTESKWVDHFMRRGPASNANDANFVERPGRPRLDGHEVPLPPAMLIRSQEGPSTGSSSEALLNARRASPPSLPALPPSLGASGSQILVPPLPPQLLRKGR